MVASSGTKAIANADKWSSYNPPGYCLKWVRAEAWQIGGLYGSAIDAWNGATKRHPGDRNPPDGAPCFYRGGTYGHIVIYRTHNSGRIRSTDCTYSGKVSDAALSWPETAWGDTYLGWTEDLNGVDLPLASSPPPPEDDMPTYERVRLTKTLKVKADTWTSIPWDTITTGKAVKAGDTAVYADGFLVATLTAAATPTKADDSIRTRWLERSTDKGETVTNETWAAVEHKVTGGATYLSDSRTQKIADGRRFVCQVYFTNGGSISSAELNALHW